MRKSAQTSPVKYSRPVIPLQLSVLDKFLEAASLVLLVYLIAMTLVIYYRLPEEIPVHFNAAGEVNRYGNKSTILIFAVIAPFLYVIFTVLNKYPHKFNYPVHITPGNALKQYIYVTRFLRAMKTSILFFFILLVHVIYKAVQSQNGALNPLLLPALMALIFIPIVIYFIYAWREK